MRHERFRDPSGAVRRGEWHKDSVSVADETAGFAEVERVGPPEHIVGQ